MGAAEGCFRRLLELPSPEYIQCGVESGIQAEKSLFMLGAICRETGRIPEAEMHLRMAVARRPDYSEALLFLGDLCLSQGRRQEVECVIQRLESSRANRAVGWALRGRMLIVDRRLADAQRWLEAAIEASPGFLWPWLLLSDVLAQTHADWARCVQVNQRIMELDPDHPVIRQRMKVLRAQRQGEGHPCCGP